MEQVVKHCLNCVYWKTSAEDLDWFCWCKESEYFAEHTPGLHSCECWEGEEDD